MSTNSGNYAWFFPALWTSDKGQLTQYLANYAYEVHEKGLDSGLGCVSGSWFFNNYSNKRLPALGIMPGSSQRFELVTKVS